MKKNYKDSSLLISDQELANQIWSDLNYSYMDNRNQFSHKYNDYKQLVSVNDILYFTSKSHPSLVFMFKLDLGCHDIKNQHGFFITMFKNNKCITPFYGLKVEKLLVKKVFSLDSPCNSMELNGNIHYWDYDKQIIECVSEEIDNQLPSLKANNEYFIETNIHKSQNLTDYLSSFIKVKVLMDSL